MRRASKMEVNNASKECLNPGIVQTLAISHDQVSVVVPVFNVFEYLPKCVDSLLKQTYKNIEIILVDDGSFDGSETLCDEYVLTDQRVRAIHKSNGGLSSARNAGIHRANAEWITFVDADDYVEETYIETLLALVKEYAADIAVTSFKFVTEKRVIDHGTKECAVMSGAVAVRRMLLDDGFDMGAWAKLYRTKFFNRYKFPEGKSFEDSFTTYQVMSEASNVAFKSESLYNYINRSGSIVQGRFNLHKLDLIEMTKKAEVFISDKYPHLSDVAHRRVVWAYFSTLNQVLNSGTRDQIQRYAPGMSKYLLSQKAFILKNSFVPKRDKVAYLMLRCFGIKGYWRAWNLYERMAK